MRIFFLFFLFLFFFGCIQINKEISNLVEYKKLKLTPENLSLDLSECQAFICNGSKIGWKASVLEFMDLFDKKYYIQKCWIENFDPFNDSQMTELIEMAFLLSEKGYVREFMYGVGPTVSAGDEAQRFCGALGFVIHDLGGSYRQDKDPDTIDISVLDPLLKSEIIPILLYEPRHDDDNFSAELAKNVSKLDRTVILAIKDYKGIIGYNFKEENYLKIKGNCKKCLTASYISFNSTRQLEEHSKYTFLALNKKAIDFIDIVIYNFSLNDFQCDKVKVLDEMMKFSENITQTYKKPTIVVLSARVDSNCTEKKIAENFDNILSYIPYLVKSGIMGIAYEDLAFFFSDDGSPRKEIFNSWFANCREYYTTEETEGSKFVLSIHSLGAKYLSLCPTILYPASAALILKCEYLNVSYVEPIDLENFNEPITLDLKDGITEKGDIAIYYQNHPDFMRTIDGYEGICERWSSQIRTFTSHYKFDYSFVRAVVWKENKFISHSEYWDTPKYPLDPQEKVDLYCSKYPANSNNFRICHGVERLKYYLEKGYNITKKLDESKYPIEKYYPFYISYLGYKYGEIWLNDYVRNYTKCFDDCEKEYQSCMEKCKSISDKDEKKKCEESCEVNRGNCRNNCKNSYFNDITIKQIPSDAEAIREICIKREFLTSNGPWLGSYSGTLFPPLKNPECVFGFNKPMGVYWNSGVILKDKTKIKDVFAAASGKVMKVGESPRLGKYIIIQGGGWWFRYSGLSWISVNKNDQVTAGQKIGETTKFLRFEVCNRDCDSKYINPEKRGFVNPENALGLKCK